jgi:broad specificity phosphatase PhoE
MKLLIVAHAQTKPDPSGVSMAGSMKDLLTESGMQDAENLVQHLMQERIHYVYCSDMQSIATAHVISDEIPDVTVMLTKDLRTKESNEDADQFLNRIKLFLEGIKNKYDRENVLVITHDDVILSMVELLGNKKSGRINYASVTEYNIDRSGNAELIRFNDTGFLA